MSLSYYAALGTLQDPTKTVRVRVFLVLDYDGMRLVPLWQASLLSRFVPQ